MLRTATPFIPYYLREGRNRERESSRPRHDGKEALATWGYTFRTRDNHWIVMMAPLSPAQRTLYSKMAGEALHDEPLHDARIFHRIWTDYCLTRDRADLLADLNAASVPVGPVNSIADLCADPHVRERNLVTLPDHLGEPITMQGVVPRLARKPGGVRWAGEPLGASNDEVFRGLLHLPDEQLAALAAKKII
jgi:formyl-CoA transferase